MNILDNSDKRLLPLLPEIILDKLGKKVVKIKFIGGGSFGRVYKAELSDGSTIAVKAYRIQLSQYEEERQLTILAENTSVPMPKVLFTFEDSETALLAMTFVDGQNVLNPSFLLKSKAQKKDFADSVISGMLQWHKKENDKFGYLSAPVYDTWYDFYKTEKQQPILEGLKELCDKGKFSKKKLSLLLEATEVFNSLPKECAKPVLIHGDLNIMNIMADPKDFTLTAFIDPCGTLWADREYDLFQLRNMWGDAYGLYNTYKDKCKMSQYTDFRVAYYGAIHECSMRLAGGLIAPFLEDLVIARLKKEIKKLKK